MKMFSLLKIFSLRIAPFIAFAGAAISQEPNTLQVDRWPMGLSWTVAAKSSISLIPGGGSLRIVDMSTVGNVNELSVTTLPGVLKDIYTQNDIAYVAAQSGGFHILDISNPAQPVNLSSLSISSELVLVNEHIAFTVNADEMIRLIDVSDPTCPVPVSSCSVPCSRVSDLGFNDGFLFLLCYTTGSIAVLDCREIEHPVFTTTIEYEGTASHFLVDDGVLFLANRGNGLRIYDVSDIDSIELIGSLEEFLFYPTDVSRMSDYVFVSSGLGELAVVDISVLSQPEIVASLELFITANRIETDNGYAHVSHPTLMETIDVRDPTSPILINTIDTGGSTIDLCIEENYVFVADYPFGLRIVSTTEPSGPAEIGNLRFDSFGGAGNVQFLDDYAIVSDLNFGLRVIDIDDNSQPAIVDGYELDDCSVSDLEILNDFIFMSLDFYGVEVLGIDDDSRPYLICSYDSLTPGQIFNIAVTDSLLIAIDVNGVMSFLDITNTTSPELIARHTYWGVSDTQIRNHYGFAAQVNEGLLVFDLDDLTELDVVANLQVDGIAKGITIHNNLALITDAESKFHVIDIRDPLVPMYSGYGSTYHIPSDIDVYDGLVYVADTEDGFYVFRVDPQFSVNRSSVHRRFSTIETYPNPFNDQLTIGYKTAVPGHVHVRVYNCLGQLVRELGPEYCRAGMHQRMFKAESLASGTYYIQVDSGESRDTARITLIR